MYELEAEVLIVTLIHTGGHRRRTDGHKGS